MVQIEREILSPSHTIESEVKKRLSSVAERVASTKIGQNVLQTVDKVLMVIEQTAKWSLPISKDKEQSKSSTPIRPLPWIFFLPALLMLRFFRAGLSYMLIVIGKNPILPEHVIRFVQTQRRNIRQLKYQGVRNMRYSEHNALPNRFFPAIECILERLFCTRSTIESTMDHDDTERIVVGKRESKEKLNCSESESVASTSSQAKNNGNDEYNKLITNQSLSENDENDADFTMGQSNTDSGTEISELDVSHDTETSQVINKEFNAEFMNALQCGSSPGSRPTVLITSDYDDHLEGLETPPKSSTEGSLVESFEYQTMDGTDHDSYNSVPNNSKAQDVSIKSKTGRNSKSKSTPKKIKKTPAKVNAVA